MFTNTGKQSFESKEIAARACPIGVASALGTLWLLAITNFSDFVLAELAAQAIWQCLGNLHIDELSDQLLIIR